MRGPPSSAEAVFVPLDRARRAALAQVARAWRPLVVDRETRVAVVATASIFLAFVATAVAPLWLLLLGPIVLGVPHVVADVRYLVVRPALHKRWPLWILAGVPLVWSAVGGGVRAGMLATAGAFFVARGSRAVRAIGVAAALGFFALAWLSGPVADVAFAHIHNFVGVALFWAWRRRARGLHRLPLGAFVFGALLLALGVAARRLDAFPDDVGGVLVPYELFAFGGRLVALYAFAQAVHYSIWIRLIPDEDRAQPTPRPFAASFRALVADMGPWFCAVAALGAVGFAVYALVDLVAARNAYLQFAIFHGHMELAAGALLLVERRLPLTRAAAPS